MCVCVCVKGGGGYFLEFGWVNLDGGVVFGLWWCIKVWVKLLFLLFF